MADELEVLEKQQLSAQRSLNDLTDQLTLADHLVYKKYLTELQNYGMVELSQQMLDVQDPAQCIQLFQLQKLTLKKGEDMFQKLSTVYYSSMAQGCSLAVMIDVPEENVGANIYLGVREDPLKKNMKSRDLDTSSKALQKVLSSNFPGSETRGIPRQEEKELLDGAFGDTQEAVASVSCVAALRDKSRTEDKAFVQGIERFMDAMDGEVYTALFLAEPVSAETQAEMPESAVYHKPVKTGVEINTEFIFGQLAQEAPAKCLNDSEMEQLKRWLKRHEIWMKPEERRYIEQVFQGELKDRDKTRKMVFDFFGGMETLIQYCYEAEKTLTPRRELVNQLQGRYALQTSTAEWALNCLMTEGLQRNPDRDAAKELRKNFLEQGGKVM